MIKINLLPKEIQDKGKGVEWVILGGAIAGLFAVIAMSSYLVKLQAYKKDVAKKARWSAELAAIKTKVNQVSQLDGQKNILNAKKNTVVQLLQGRLLYPKVLESFYATLPEEIWLTNISFKEDPKRNIMLVANSNALTIDAIADWLQTLESDPKKYISINLSAIEVVSGGANEPPTFSFKMSFTYIPPAGT